MRSPGGLDVHLPSATAGQRRKQGLAQHREGTTLAGAPSFSERYWGACICKAPLFPVLVFGVHSWAEQTASQVHSLHRYTLPATLTLHNALRHGRQPAERVLSVLAPQSTACSADGT